MKKYLFFNDSNSDLENYAVDADQITSIVPETTTTTVMYVKQHDKTVDKITFTHDDKTTTTGHRVREISQAIAQAANAGPHTNGFADVLDIESGVYYNGITFITGYTIERDTYQDYAPLANTSFEN